MRLLNESTYELQEFFDDRVPLYSILSHRWSNDEISYKEFRKGQKKDSIGYQKIVQACAFARSQKQKWIWIDTCCIDKRSSAELTEAINAMFRWYQRAMECYVYMDDVRCDNNEYRMLKQFRESLWFTRGWTLQELLAPSDCIFCDVQWHTIGNRVNLFEEIYTITGISPECLVGPTHTDRISSTQVGRKMAWASKRITGRPEDMAYCLMGLFDINMPLLYGEGGTKAFIRLQNEIVERYRDESLFAWQYDGSTIWEDETLGMSGLLAPTPSHFIDSGRIYANINVLPNYSSADANYITMTRNATQFTDVKGDMYFHYDKIPLQCKTIKEEDIYIVLQFGLTTPPTYSRVHLFGHGKSLERRVRVMHPVDIDYKEFHIRRWEWHISDYSPVPSGPPSPKMYKGPQPPDYAAMEAGKPGPITLPGREARPNIAESSDCCNVITAEDKALV